MRRFWEDVIRPCCEAADVRRIVEIGSDHGENTVKLVKYAVEKDGFVYSIDPAPQFDYEETFRGKEKYYSFLRTTSIDALSKIHDYDAILIDGDHNYYTVYTELQMVLRNTEKFPLVFFHDISWPYDRRDLYYNPDTIPPVWLNIYKVSGIDPDTDELSDKGFNHKYCNSVYYNNFHCGVLTAVEDFINENKDRFRFVQIPIMSGLGIMLDMKQEYPEALNSLLQILTPSKPLMNLMRFSDKWFAKTHCRMEQHMEANQRLKEQAVKTNNELRELREEKEALKTESGQLQQHAIKEQKKLQDANAMLQAQIEESKNELIELREEKEALKAENGQLQQQANEEQKKLQDAKAVLQAQIEETKRELRALREEKDGKILILQTESERLQQLVEEGKKQLDNAIIDQKIAFEEKRLFFEKFIAEKQKSEQQMRDLNSANKRNDDLLAQNNRLNASLTQTKKERDDAHAQIITKDRQIAHLKEEAHEYAVAADIHLNSVSYQIGSAFVAATHSPREFFRLPKTLSGLYKRGKAQTKSRIEEGKLLPAGVLALYPAQQSQKASQVQGKSPESKEKNHTKQETDSKEAAKKPQPVKASVLPSEKSPVKAPAKVIFEPSLFSSDELRRLHQNRIHFYSRTEKPLISIIVLTRNGLHHLKTLFASLKQTHFYGYYEVIVVDNASTDGSIEFIQTVNLDKPIILIENKKNETFSAANNQAVQRANGSFLLFMNNDIEVTDGWLDEMLSVAMTANQAGAVGAKLIYPEGVGGINAGRDGLIQHRGIGFRRDSFDNLPFIRPINIGVGEQAWPDDGKVRQIGVVTAAVLLVSKEAFESVGGFDEQYIYGYEDVDLCLKLLEKGYRNYYTPRAMLFHHEFGSQKEDNNQSIVARRTNNIYHFRTKWQDRLDTWLTQDRISGTQLFSEETLCFAFAVTEAGENVSAGDYFTAMELASSLAKYGHKIKYLCRRGPADWYDVGEDVDVLISMLDAYDLNNMYHTKEGLFTVAWARNWFTRWVSNPSIQQYSLVLASSKTACDYMTQATGLKVSLFPIATNADRFLTVMKQPEQPDEKEKYGCDYVFTGSYWNDPREIMDILEPKSLPYKLRIFGKNWEKVPKFAEYTGGFLEYKEMPLVYKYTQLVVDDANRVTIEYGAVNSRVFDALAAGRLVLTNGARGAEETFQGMLPVFRTAKDFKDKITYYMEHPEERKALTDRLQKFVLENHTYDIRANTLLSIISGFQPDDTPPEKKIAIMVPVPKWSEAEAWGDYHFAVAMKKCFEENGYKVEIRILPDWEKEFDGKYVIVLRGLSVYHPKKQHINLMWNISHPDDVKLEEYNQYDAVFVASLKWAEHLKLLLKVPVYPLLQCTDPDVFNGEAYADDKKRYELLFVGNSRKVFRQILKDLLPTSYDLAVYGTLWHNLIDERYIRGENIPNKQLGREYHAAAILLNDHWEDMKQKGFISNRIFDGLSAGAFIISDEIAGLSDVLKDCVVTYQGRDDLSEKIKYYMEHPEEREKMSARGMALVREKHTFRARMEEIRRVMENYH